MFVIKENISSLNSRSFLLLVFFLDTLKRITTCVHNSNRGVIKSITFILHSGINSRIFLKNRTHSAPIGRGTKLLQTLSHPLFYHIFSLLKKCKVQLNLTVLCMYFSDQWNRCMSLRLSVFLFFLQRSSVDCVQQA